MSNTAPTNAIEFLQTSVDEMNDRASQRDNAQGERSMAKTVDMFNLLYGKDLSEEQGWAFMVLLKMVRGSQGNYRADDYVDAAAYCGLQGEAAYKENRVTVDRVRAFSISLGNGSAAAQEDRAT